MENENDFNAYMEDLSEDKKFLRIISNEHWKRDMAEDVEQGRLSTFNEVIPREVWLEHFDAFLGGQDYFKNKTVVDIGAGFGGDLHRLIDSLGAKITNMDISIATVKEGKENEEEGVVADVYQLPLADNSVDVLLSTNLLNTSAAMKEEDLEEIITEFYRVIKDGGVLIQSNFGDLAMPSTTEAQLEFLKKVGFKEVDSIDSRGQEIMREMNFTGGLSYIAKK